MPPKNLNNSQLIQQLTALIPNFCDKCGARHNKGDIEIIHQDTNAISCRLDCSNCGNSYVMSINSPADGIVAGKKALLKTDITATEMKKFADVDKLDDNEILDALIALKDIKNLTDFNTLFNESD